MAGASKEAPAEARPPPSVGTLLRGFSWTGVAHVGGLVPWWGSLVVLAALLPPRAFGTVAAAAAVVQVLQLVMESGTGGRIITTRHITGEEYRDTVMLNVVVGIALAAVMAVLAGAITEAFAEGGNVGAVRALSLTLVATAFAIGPLALLQKRLQFRRLAVVRIASLAISSLIAIAAAILGAGVWALVVRQFLAQGLLALFAVVATLHIVPRREGRRAERLWRFRQPRALWFVLLSFTSFIALSVDNLIVGAATGAAELGLYALAFTLAFAPLTQFSWQLGAVLFPAAAATDEREVIGRRTLKVLRVAAALMLPLVPPAVVLAPTLLPEILGPEWQAMVAPFQMLVIAGVGYALINVIGESMNATAIAFRAGVNLAWALGTVAAVYIGVALDGIRGAALAHLVLLIPLAVVYVTAGARRIGTSVAELWRSIRSVLLPVAVEVSAMVLVLLSLGAAGLGYDAAAGIAAFIALAVAGTLLVVMKSSPVREGFARLAAARGSVG